MGVKLQSALGGSVELNAPSTASNFTMTVPAGNGTVATTDQLFGFRNRIINGDMRIDQRNDGTSVSIVGGAPKYCPDRYVADNSTTVGHVYSVQRVTDAPAGFSNSLLVTVNTGAAIGAGNYQYIRQIIEGFNFADFMFGTANAQTFTLSFWVKSSITGSHGGYLGAALNNRFRVFTYTINAANTWEYKTVTITGDTAGTWDRGNGAGLQVAWSLGAGTSYQGSTGAWGNTLLLGATGQVQLTQTTGATINITGVQLEVGTVATPFERRPHATELALCQRYCYTKSAAKGDSHWGDGRWEGDLVYISIQHPVEMRSTPSWILSNATGVQAVYPMTFWYNVTGLNGIHKNGVTASNITFSTNAAGAVPGRTFAQVGINSGSTALLIASAEL